MVAVRHLELDDVRLIDRTVTRSSRVTSSLLLMQAAMAICIVAVAAGAFRAFARLASIDVGFSRTGVTTLDVSVSDWKYATPEDRAQLDRRILESLEQIAGVTAVAGVSHRDHPRRHCRCGPAR